jgi:hypothetical protein
MMWLSYHHHFVRMEKSNFYTYSTVLISTGSLSTINQPNQPSVLVTNWFPKSHLKKGGTSFLCGGFCTFLICYQIISVIVIECL